MMTRERGDAESDLRSDEPDIKRRRLLELGDKSAPHSFDLFDQPSNPQPASSQPPPPVLPLQKPERIIAVVPHTPPKQLIPFQVSADTIIPDTPQQQTRFSTPQSHGFSSSSYGAGSYIPIPSGSPTPVKPFSSLVNGGTPRYGERKIQATPNGMSSAAGTPAKVGSFTSLVSTYRYDSPSGSSGVNSHPPTFDSPILANSHSFDQKLASLMSMFPAMEAKLLRQALLNSQIDVERAAALVLASQDTEDMDSQKTESDEDERPVRRRRLVRKKAPVIVASGSEDESDTPTRTPKRAAPKQPVIKINDTDSESDEATDVDDVQSRNRRASSAYIPQMDIQTVQFFNNASSQQLIEAVICTPEQADFVIGLRPFLDIEHLRESLSGHKSQRQLARVVDKFQEVMEGYGEVDMLISRCERFGEEVMQVLRRWTKEDAQDTETVGEKVEGDGDAPEVCLTHVDASVQGDDDEDLSGADGNYKCLSKQPAANNPDLTLKSYQLVGVSWLHMLHSKGLGGILADEMGLGKTAQVITFLGYLKAHGRRGPHLVVVPSSTLENWVREFNKWVPSLVVRSYYGSQRERDEMRDPLMDEIDEIDAIVTTYTLATGQKEDRVFLRKLHCHSLILDEGHMVKNMESARYKHLMSYKAPFRLLLTGTPLQNNLLELLALLTFIMPQLFANIESYSKIFNVKQSAAHGEAGFLSKQRIERAKKIMAPFVLRRKKAQVLKELPSKHVGIEDCTATPKQKELYDSILAESRKSLLQKDVAGEEAEAAKPQRKAKKGARPTPTKPKGAPFSEKKQIANCMMQLRKAADHPLLFRRFFSDAKLWTMSREIMREVEYMDANRDYIYEDMCIMSDFELHQLCCKFSSVKKHKLNSKHWMDAGKVKKLEELLQAMQANGDRALIFSQFVMMLDVLEAVLDTLGVRYLRLDGRTSVTERQALIDEYNTNMEVTVFLLSTKAGGFGINLTSANVVIIYDLDFNPHNDAQAEDRAHRVGQTRDVRVIKLIMKDTVEEHILRLATAKLKLDAKVQQRDEITELEDTKKPIARGRKGKSKEGEDAGAEGRESRESEGSDPVIDADFLDLLKAELTTTKE